MSLSINAVKHFFQRKLPQPSTRGGRIIWFVFLYLFALSAFTVVSMLLHFLVFGLEKI